MPSITCETSALLLVDFQSRLMPVIEGAAAVLDNARRLVDAAQLLGVPVLFRTAEDPRLRAVLALVK